jgi:selenocysteine lyase/cysteine desulfurase
MYPTSLIPQSEFPQLTDSTRCYLDYAATSPVHSSVLTAIQENLMHRGAAGRGSSQESLHASSVIDDARSTIANFLSCPIDQVSFTHGATHASQLLAHSLAHTLGPDSTLAYQIWDHHSTLVPWMAHAHEAKATIRPYEPSSPVTHLVTSHASNVTGEHCDIQAMASSVRQRNPDAIIILDVSQTVLSHQLQPTTWGIDALFWSAHKHHGPNGIGTLWTSPRLRGILDLAVIGGGGAVQGINDNMIPEHVAFPAALEAGSMNQEAIAGFAASIKLLMRTPFQDRHAHLAAAADDLANRLHSIPDITVLHHPGSSIVSIAHAIVHPHDLAEVLDSQGIVVRAGQHCASLLHAAHNLPATLRFSAGLPTCASDIDTAISATTAALTKLMSYYGS